MTAPAQDACICPAISFESKAAVVGRLPDFDQEAVKREPMFFNAWLGFAYENGGPITRAFIDALPHPWSVWTKDAVLDSRVHMLMPGWIPAIPGWHHDDVPRPEQAVGKHFGAAGQPDYVTPRYHAEHVMALADVAVSRTEFALGTADMPEVLPGEVIYGRWSPVVSALIDAGELERWQPQIGDLISFDCHTFHRAVEADGSGWRWFCRVSRNTERTKQITNERRVQVQVYLSEPERGW